MEYKSEKEFLKNYDPNKYDRPSITCDIMITSISSEQSNNYRKLSEKKFSILLVKRNNYPFKDMWCLPGGFMNMQETLDEAAKRILAIETNLHNIYLEQLYTFSSIDRDPRMRIVSTTYMSLIDKNQIQDKLTPNASWFNLHIKETNNKIYVNLDNGTEEINFVVKKEYAHKTTDKYHFEVIQNDKLAFDHPLVIVTGLERLKNKIEYTDIAFNLMPKYFTLSELQQVYETILNKKLIIPDFRRKIKDKVIKTDKLERIGGHRPSSLYKYKSNLN